MSRPKKQRRKYSTLPKPSRRPALPDDASTSRQEYPALEGREPLPEEITGRASATSDDLVALIASTDEAHLADGFRGGSEDEVHKEVPPVDP